MQRRRGEDSIMLKIILKNKKLSQVWIETVIYTLIGLTVIGLLLSFAKPKIEAIRDKAVIDQTINALTDLDKQISDIIIAPGNIRYAFFTIKRGELTINPSQDTIEYVLKNSKYIYSELNKNATTIKMNLGTLYIKTEGNKSVDVKLWIDYSEYLDIKYNMVDTQKTISAAAIPYKIGLNNKGKRGEVNLIDVTVS